MEIHTNNKLKQNLISIFFILILIHLSFSIKGYNFKSQELITKDLKCSSSIRGKSIILMIGDGMGFEQLKLARWVEIGKDDRFSMEKLPFHLNVTTNSSDNLITDSAAAATAMATGNKTNNGMLAISPLLEPLETILEIAHQLGKSTGIITTTALTHATPAAFMTHVKSRYNTSEISRQIVENSNVSILLGGGKDYFSASQLLQLEMKGYHLLENRSQLISTNYSNLIGLFAPTHLPYEIERNPEISPSLSDMTIKALEILSQDPEGFFLLVEGGRIDHGGHKNNKTNVALETIEFHYAVNTAISYSKTNGNVLLLITSDHETGGLTILNDTLTNNIPTSNKNAEENRLIRIERINNISVSWTTTCHTNQDVPFFGYRTDFYGLNNLSIIDNTELFNIMKAYFSITLVNDSNSLIELIIGVVIAGFTTTIFVIIYLWKKKKKLRG